VNYYLDPRRVLGIYQLSTYTLTSTTNVQKLFDASPNGALTLSANTAYRFWGQFRLASMSSTSGNALLDLLGAGTATISSIQWHVWGMDGTTPSTGAAVTNSFHSSTAAPGNIFTGGVGTGMWGTLEGFMRVGAGGTIIPSIGLTTAAAAVVQANSFFELVAVGPDTLTTNGPWN